MGSRDTEGAGEVERGVWLTPTSGGRRVEDEEDDLGLPAFDGADDDPAAGVGLEADLVEPGAESEDVGLDATEGTDEPLDAELNGTDAEEATRWSVDGEDAGDLDADADLPADHEYGWTDHNEPADDDGLDDEPELDGEPLLPGDRGEEGLEDADGGEGDLASLPPLDSGPEEPDADDPFALDVLRELTGGAMPEEPEPGSAAP